MNTDRVRSVAATGAAILAVIGVVLAMTAMWARATIFDSDRVAEAVDAALEEPEVTHALAAYLTDELLDATRLDEVLTERFDPPWNLIEPLVVEGVRIVVREGVDRTLQRPEVRDALVELSRRAHQAVLRVLRGEPAVPGVRVRDGAVSVNLLPVLGEGLGWLQDRGLLDPLTIPPLDVDGDPDDQRRALESAFGREFPEDLGQLVVYRSDALDGAADWVTAARTVIVQAEREFWLLIALTIGPAAGAVLLARRTRRMLVALGVGAASAMLITRALLTRTIDDVPAAIANRGAALAIERSLAAITHGLITVVTVAAIIGVLVAVVAALSGPGHLAAASREHIARRADALAIGGLGAAVFALVIGGISWASITIAAVVLVLSLIGPAVLRKRSRPVSAV